MKNEVQQVVSKDQGPSKGKAKLSLLPAYSLTSMARIMEGGATRYGRFDYVRGYPYSFYDDAFNRHMLAWRSGEDMDPDDGQPHLLHAACCCIILAEMQAIEVGTDDRKKQLASPRKAG